VRIRVDARFRRRRSAGPEGELGMRRRDERRPPVRFSSVRSGPERDSASEGPAARSRGRAERRVEANSPSGHGGRRWRAAGSAEASRRRRAGGPGCGVVDAARRRGWGRARVGGGPEADAVGEGPTRRAAADRGSPDGGDAAAPNPSGARADGRAEAVRF